MPAHPILIAKLKEVLSDHMKLLPGAPTDLEDYVVWSKTFIGYLNCLETLDGFMLDADVNKWIEEVSAALEPIAICEWLEWGMHVLPQLLALVQCEHEIATEREKARAQEEQATAAKAKEEARITHRKVREAEKLALLMANKISLDDFECNSDDEQMSLDVTSMGDVDGDTEMTALTSETGGDISVVSDFEKGKGRAEKQKTAEVAVSELAIAAKRAKRATQHEPKVIPDGAVLVNDPCDRCASDFSIIYACYCVPGAEKCTKCVQDKKRCSLVTEASRGAVPVIKVELADTTASGSSVPRPKPTVRSSGSSTISAVTFVKKPLDELERLAMEGATASKATMSLSGLLRAEDTITW
ncbi:hypothetical protein EW146_g7280 [Bondarzewia mesenterica]|uniref:Uncharacterized protein n=1 Tax=Bondarzewia mesenterica TaxID=1095465 RepID=A0A4S4LLS6_9AGAM|nr:hypothetical protein EW146_g7280 [Bondarzewia mesenterica]